MTLNATLQSPTPRLTARCTRWLARGLATGLGLAVSAPAADAQFIVELRAGATGTSNLVTDIIVDDITARPAIAPTLAVSVGTRLDSLYTVHLNGAWVQSDVGRRQAGTTTKIVSLTTWQGSVSLGRRSW